MSHSVDVTRGMSLFSTHALSMVTFPTVSDISVRSFQIGVSLSRYVMKAFVISMEMFVIENNVTTDICPEKYSISLKTYNECYMGMHY